MATRWIRSLQQIIQSPMWILFLGFMLLYSLTYAGVFRQDDEHILASRAQSLALWGELAEPQVYGNQRVQALLPLGDKATQIEPAHALLAAPLYQIGIAAGGGGVQMMFVLNIFISAVSVVVVYACAQVLGNSPQASLWTAVLFGAGTMVWPFSATLYRDSLAMLLAACAWLVWLKLERSAKKQVKWVLLLGLALTAGLLAKNTNMSLVLAILLVSGCTWVIGAVRDRRLKSLALGLGGIFGLVAVWLILVPPEGPLARFSVSYLWDLAKHARDSLTFDLAGALAGPLISPAKSIFLFSPPLIFGLAGIKTAWRGNRRAFLVGLLTSFFLFLGQGLFYRDEWAGIYGWGLRYTLPLLVIVMPLLAAPVFERLLEKGRNGRIVLAAVLVTGLAVQLAGVLPDWRQMYTDWATAGIDPYRPSAAWDLNLNAIPAGWSLIPDTSNWLSAWVRLLHAGQLAAWLVPATILLIALMLFIFSLASKVSSVGLGVWGLAVTSLAVCFLPLAAVRFAYLYDPAWGGDRPDLQAAVDWVNDRIDSRHPVVIDAYATPLWMVAMNTWRSQARWYALPYEIPQSGNPPEEGISQASRQLVEQLLSETGGLWYVISPDAPDYSFHQEAQWLAGRVGSTGERQFGTLGEVKVWGFGNVDWR